MLGLAHRKTKRLQNDEQHQIGGMSIREVNRPVEAERWAGQGQRNDQKSTDDEHAAGRRHHRLEARLLADWLVVKVDGASLAQGCGQSLRKAPWLWWRRAGSGAA